MKNRMIPVIISEKAWSKWKIVEISLAPLSKNASRNEVAII